MHYLKNILRRNTPQTEPLAGQVPNSDIGYSWAVDDWTRLSRFLVLGSEGGSFYAGERELTRANATAVERCLLADGPRAVAEKLDLLLAVDVRGTVLASWAAVDLMRSQGTGGVILNMSWDHVSFGMKGENPILYSAAKGGVMSFSKSLAREVAPEIRVNILAPGFIDTAFGQESGDAWRREVESRTPLRRWGTPDDVAAAAAYLASDDARFLTGQMLMVNGGVVM